MMLRHFFKKIIHSGLIWLWLALLLVLIDQSAKNLAIQHLEYQHPLQVLPFFNLTLTYNKGAAFGFLHNAAGWQNVFLGGLASIIAVVILVWLSRLSRRDTWMCIALCFIFAGAFGNLWDRLKYGYVVDFLSFHAGKWYFAIFNVADSQIFIGACMIILYWLLVAEE